MEISTRLAFCTVFACLVAGCAASPKARVESGLRNLGMPDRPAACMADELDERLSRRNMKRIAEVLDEGRKGGDARPGRVIEQLDGLDDPAITEATAKAGISCTLLR